MRACACSLRRNATWRTRATWRSSTYAPTPVSSRGSSTRLMRAPTIFGRRCTSGDSVITLPPLAQARPLGGVVAAQDGGAGGFEPPDLGQRIGQRVGVPGIAWKHVAVERRPQAHRIGG